MSFICNIPHLRRIPLRGSASSPASRSALCAGSTFWQWVLAGSMDAGSIVEQPSQRSTSPASVGHSASLLSTPHFHTPPPPPPATLHTSKDALSHPKAPTLEASGDDIGIGGRETTDVVDRVADEAPEYEVMACDFDVSGALASWACIYIVCSIISVMGIPLLFGSFLPGVHTLMAARVPSVPWFTVRSCCFCDAVFPLAFRAQRRTLKSKVRPPLAFLDYRVCLVCVIVRSALQVLYVTSKHLVYRYWSYTFFLCGWSRTEYRIPLHAITKLTVRSDCGVRACGNTRELLIEARRGSFRNYATTSVWATGAHRGAQRFVDAVYAARGRYLGQVRSWWLHAAA